MIHREVHDEIEVLRMAHGKASAFDVELADALTDAFEAFSASPARALVLTGTGKIFSAGVDLFRVLEGGRGYLERFLPALDRALEALVAIEKPVVAAINGHAIAGGCIVACACDRRIAARGDARLGVPELAVGVPFPALALELVREAWPVGKARDALFLGGMCTLEQALQQGLVDELVEPAGLIERALSVAHELGSIPAMSFALTKRRYRRPLFALLAAHGGAAARETLDTWASPDAMAAVRSYVERTIRR